MKKEVFIVFQCIILSFILCLSKYCAAQKYCDIAINIAYPQYSDTISYGDTVTATVSITNLGPDTLFATNDSVFYGISVSPVPSIQFPDLNPGDTVSYPVFQYVNEEAEDRADSFCIFYLPYATTYIDTNSANDTACVTFILSGNNTAIGRIDKRNEDVQIFPNPASGRIAIRTKNTSSRQYNIQILDMLGSVRGYYPDAQFKDGVFEINISNLQPAIYILQLNSGDQYYQEKIVVQ